ncbi:MAG: DUF3592 domain-containing protein [Planctomycetota bacterium]|jgi:uncharacterized membrane protein YecN with MAPEG domain
MKFFFSRIFPLIFIAAGAITLYFGVRGIARARASVDWPTARGRIVSSTVDRRRSSSGSRRGSSTTYHAEVLYELSVDGTAHDGSRVAYGDYGSSNPSHARRVVNRYPKGTQVAVHYMPGNPEECLLEAGMKAQSWFVPLFGLVFFAAGCMMAVFLPKAMRKQKAATRGVKSGPLSARNRRGADGDAAG